MMALVTGTPLGNITSSEDIFLDSAVTLWFQDYNATPLNNPDADGYYWGMSGTTTYPTKEIGCLTDISFTEGITANDVLCDNVGVKSTIQQRNYVEFQLTVQTTFPLDILSDILKGSAVTETSPTQKFGFGPIDNTKFWMVYGVRVYDQTAGDYVWYHLHKCQFVNAFTISMPFGQNWQVTGIALRAFADTTKPSAQQFGMFGRSDLSVIT